MIVKDQISRNNDIYSHLIVFNNGIYEINRVLILFFN